MTTTAAVEALMQDDAVSVVRPEMGALEAITRSEVAMQLDAAHRYPRNVTNFLRDAISMATLSVEIAESCMYSVPRDGKMITGPSVRLAEICSSSWGNMHAGARVIDTGEREITAQAVCWDLEKNLRVTIEAQRSIMGDKGRKRYGDSMIQTTGMAAISIALRNAVFRVIPRAYVDAVYAKARECAVGDIKTLGDRRDTWLASLGRMGVTPDRIFARLGVPGAADITLEHLATLIGIGNAIKSGELQLDDAFPLAGPTLVRSNGSPLDALVSAHKAAPPSPAPAPVPANDGAPPASKPAPKEPPLLSWPMVHAALGQADPNWTGEDRLPVIMTWSDEQMRLAYNWSVAYNDEQLDDEQLPERPAFTVLERQAGEEG
jgi:hypothetical protein